MIEYGNRTQKLPAPPGVVWDSLATPHAVGARPWLNLLDREVEPRVLGGERPHSLEWTSLWTFRPDDRIVFDLEPAESGTALRFRLLTPDAAPDDSTTGHLRRRMNVLLFADLRFSYGQ